MDITIPSRDADIGNAVLRLVRNDSIPPSHPAELRLASKSTLDLNQRSVTVSLSNIKENWLKLISSAQAFWWKLSAKELHKTNGREQKLIDLVRKRYFINQFDAKKQVKRFFQQARPQ